MRTASVLCNDYSASRKGQPSWQPPLISSNEKRMHHRAKRANIDELALPPWCLVMPSNAAQAEYSGSYVGAVSELLSYMARLATARSTWWTNGRNIISGLDCILASSLLGPLPPARGRIMYCSLVCDPTPRLAWSLS